MAAQISLSIDTTVRPCQDFYQHICGNFNKVQQIAPGEASVDSFSVINRKINKELKVLLENQKLSNENLPQTQAAIFYRSCMDKSQRDKVSKSTILKSLNAINEKMTLDEALVTSMEKGITSRLIDIRVSPDSKNPQYFILKVTHPGLILSANTLRSPKKEDSMRQIAHYKKFMATVLGIVKVWPVDQETLNDIIDLNIKVAKIIPSIPDQQNPDKSYNKISIHNLQKRCSEISWKYIINRLLRDSGKELTDNDDILVSSLPYIDGLCDLLKLYKANDTKKSILYKDLQWAELSALTTYGSEDLVKASEELKRYLFGVKGQREQWQICVKYTSKSLQEIISNMYIRKYFDASMKKDIENMVYNIRKILKEVLENATWMDNGTKDEALKKLSRIGVKIGYPDYILDEIRLKQESEGLQFNISNFVDNFYLFNQWNRRGLLKFVNEKIADDKWFKGSHEVNAYYIPWKNEIVFPAAILQYPFYDIGLPVPSKYGGIGMVIAHEIIHAFDTQGSKYDNKGLLRDWWTKETRQKYLQKAKCIQNQYGNYSIFHDEPKLRLKSKQTIGEDIADNAGLRMTYKASLTASTTQNRLPGLDFTSQQLLFVQKAWIWCQTSTKESIVELWKTNPHTIGKFRVIGSMSNMPEFSEAFKCTNDDKLMNRANKCLVW